MAPLTSYVSGFDFTSGQIARQHLMGAPKTTRRSAAITPPVPMADSAPSKRVPLSASQTGGFRRPRRRSAVRVVIGGVVAACVAFAPPVLAHVLPMAVAQHRADAILDDLSDDPLNPVTFADDACHRVSRHKVHCELFLQYDSGDTCARDYYVFFASAKSDRLRSRLDGCR